MDFKKVIQLVGNAGVAVAVLASVAFALDVLDLATYVIALGIGGFAGLEGLRQAIQSSGYKTHIIAAVGALLSIGVGFGQVTPETATMLFGVLGIGALPALEHAIRKVKG